MTERQTFAFITKTKRFIPIDKQRGIVFRVLLYCLFLVILSQGCKQSAQPWESFGERVTETRPLQNFTQINASHNIQLFIKQDLNSPQSVQITYGKNALKGIISEVKNGELILDDRNKAKWLRNLNELPSCTLNIHNINKIHLDGNAKMVCLDTIKTPALNLTINSVEIQHLLIQCGQLYGELENSGYLNASGTATIFSWSCEKGSGLDARELLSDDVYMRHFTIQDVYVNPTKQFEGYAYNSGDIYYFTQPTYKFKVVEEGRGKVKLFKP